MMDRPVRARTLLAEAAALEVTIDDVIASSSLAPWGHLALDRPSLSTWIP
ncbi:MAG: hypothetical protein ACYCV7_12815 [Acidimicrobiales bacterium]